MAKRFIDTGFLDQKWIRKLSPDKKVFLIYLMLKCDNGGIIDLDLEDASFWIGKEIKDINFLPNNYLIPLNNLGKFFIPKFIEWQYRDLSSNKFIVAQARQILEKHGLINNDFTLNLHNCYVKVTKDVPEFQEQGIGIGKGTGIGMVKEKEIFDEFRKKYPGTKRGNDIEFENFKKKHKDWKDVLPLLLEKLNYQIKAREENRKLGGFVPEWKNLQTWINQRCWEEEISKHENNSRNSKRSSGYSNRSWD